MDFIHLAERFAEKTKKKRDIEAELGDVKKELAELEKQILAVHALSGIGSSVKLDMGGTLIVSEKVAAKKTDPNALVAWLDANGMGEIAPRGVNGNTLSALLRERLDKGESIPEGVEKVEYKQVSWRK